MIFIFDIALLGITTIYLNALLRHSSRPPYLISSFILPYSILVLTGEIASILQKINPVFYLQAHLSVAIIAWLVWLISGKPSLLGPFANRNWAFWRGLPPFRSEPALYILAIGVVFVYLFGAGQIFILPQNNFDSMTYHLSRVGYWMQHQNLAPWPTPNPRQTTSPINAELGLLWTILLWGTDQLTGFIQWFSAFGIALAIYGLARLMGASRSQGVFAALLWATFPQIVLQSTTTQNDLVVTFFFISSLYFLFQGIRIQKTGLFILSGISFGLAIGTKATIFIVLPGFSITMLLLWLLKGRFGFRILIRWGIASLLGIGLLGIYTYVQNQVYYGNPLSIPEWTSYVSDPKLNPSRSVVGMTNLVLYLSQFIDLLGIPKVIALPLGELKSTLLKWLLLNSNIPFKLTNMFSLSAMVAPPAYFHEDTSWFGPLSFLLLIPASVWQGWRGIKERDIIRLGLVISGLGFYIILSFLMSWTPYRGRYFVLLVSLLAPLVAFLYKPSRKLGWIYWLFMVLGLWTLGSTILSNFSKPMVGPDAVWGRTSVAIRMINNPKMKPVLKMVEDHVPGDAVLATRLGVDDWDYIFFGKDFRRKIIQLDPGFPGIDMEQLNVAGAEYVLLAPRERPFLEIPTNFEWIGEEIGWLLFAVQPEMNLQPPTEIVEQVQGLRDDQGLLSIDNSLAKIVGLTELYTVDWGVEEGEGGGFKWLGEGLNQGLRGFLWSEVEIPVTIEFHLRPGPSREDAARNLQIAYLRYGPHGPLVNGGFGDRIVFDKPTMYRMVIQLQRGLNEFRIVGLDKATIPSLPNGDTRPLLVLLTHIDVLPFVDEPVIFQVEESLKDEIQVSEQPLAFWGFEKTGDHAFQWLGEGLAQGFRGYMWVEEELAVRIILSLIPGPSREDLKRNIEVAFFQFGSSGDRYQVRETTAFSSPSQIEMEVKLYPGLNVFQLQALDEATIEMLPNGDTRALLVQLTQIDLLPVDD